MTLDEARPGMTAWRIGARSSYPVKCEVVHARNGVIECRASRFARNTMSIRPEDAFADREACRDEINRRAAGVQERTYAMLARNA